MTAVGLQTQLCGYRSFLDFEAKQQKAMSTASSAAGYDTGAGHIVSRERYISIKKDLREGAKPHKVLQLDGA